MWRHFSWVSPVFLALFLLSCASLQPAPSPSATDVPTSAAASAAIPAFRHVFVIFMENHEYGEIVGSSEAPYINHLMGQYAVAGRYDAIRHPSLPNYLAAFSGSTQGMTYDCADCLFDAPNLADQLESHGKTWKSYQEDLPEPCFQGSSASTVPERLNLDGYVRRHDPPMNFSDIARNPVRCRNVVPYARLADDLKSGQVPDFAWITPSLRHDMHNGTVAEGDQWLAENLPPILNSAAWRDDGVIFLTWDEGITDEGCCGDAAGGHVLMVAISPRAWPGYVSPVPYTHYSLLRTIEDAWNLGHLVHAADPETRPMGDLFEGVG